MKSNRLVLISISAVTASFMLAPFAHAQNLDVSLLPIAADEPIPPLGFPPLPDRLDLPIAQAAQYQGYKPAAAPTKRYGGGYERAPLPVSERDAFSQPEPAGSNREQSGVQPNYQRSNESSGQRVEAPQPIMIDQSHTQDLSMPDDNAQKNSGGNPQSNFSRNKQQLQNNLIRKPIMNLRSKLGIF